MTAGLAVLVAVLLAPVLSKLPDAILGALVFVAVLGLIDVKALVTLFHFDRNEFGLAAIVAILGLTVGLLAAVAGGVLLTLYVVLRETNRPHITQLTRHDGHWIEGPANVLSTSADPLVVRTRIGLYTANLRPNTATIRALMSECAPRPATLVWDLSDQPVITSTIMGGLRDAENEFGDVRVVYAALSEQSHRTAQRWQWWQQVEREGRYCATVNQAVGR